MSKNVRFQSRPQKLSAAISRRTLKQASTVYHTVEALKCFTDRMCDTLSVILNKDVQLKHLPPRMGLWHYNPSLQI